jgi:hypothetical protein
MNKEFVPYEQALGLKELGFDEPCFGFYTYEGKFSNELSFNEYKNTALKTSSPLYQQAFRWFRETHGYNCFITSSILNGKWFYFREDLNDRTKDSEPELTPKFDTFEEAQLECLKQLIGMITLKL